MELVGAQHQRQRTPSVASTATTVRSLAIPRGYTMIRENGLHIIVASVETDEEQGRWIVRKNAQSGRTYYKNEATGAKVWELPGMLRLASSASLQHSPLLGDASPSPENKSLSPTHLRKRETLMSSSATSSLPPSSPTQLQQRHSNKGSPRTDTNSGNIVETRRRRLAKGMETSALAAHRSVDPDSMLAQLESLDTHSELDNEGYDAIAILERVAAHRRELERSCTLIHTPKGTRDANTAPRFSYYEKDDPVGTVEDVGDDPERLRRFEDYMVKHKYRQNSSSGSALTSPPTNRQHPQPRHQHPGESSSRHQHNNHYYRANRDETHSTASSSSHATGASSRLTKRTSAAARHHASALNDTSNAISGHSGSGTTHAVPYRKLAFSSAKRGAMQPSEKNKRDYSNFVIEGVQPDQHDGDEEEEGEHHEPQKPTNRKEHDANDEEDGKTPQQGTKKSSNIPTQNQQQHQQQHHPSVNSEAKYLRSRLSDMVSTVKHLKQHNEQLNTANTALKHQLQQGGGPIGGGATRGGKRSAVSVNPSKETSTDDLPHDKNRTAANRGGSAMGTGQGSKSVGAQTELVCAASLSPRTLSNLRNNNNTDNARRQQHLAATTVIGSDGAVLQYDGLWGTENLMWSSSASGGAGKHFSSVDLRLLR